MTDSRALTTALVGGVALALAILVSLMLGLVQLGPFAALHAVFSPATAAPQDTGIVWSIRLPRVLVAALVGAGLATAGAVMQAVLRNPLAEPGITGVSAGAAVGAVGSIILGFGGSLQWGVPIAAFVGAAAVTLILLAVVRARPDLGPSSIILVGVALNALAGAIIALLIANAPDDALVHSATFWLAGDLDLRDWSHVALAVGPILLGIALILWRSTRLDTLSLGADVAWTSGINVTRERTMLLLIASLVTAVAVSVSGVISFVGLIVPHALRLVVGASHARLVPLSAVVGSAVVVIADTIARTAFHPAVLQTGVICAVLCAPVFLGMLLWRRR